MPSHASGTSKDVKYLNKDFNSFRDSLMEFAKTYFPNTYNDFNEADPGMMFIEMASYVGDVLSFYIDEQFKETLLAYAEEKKTIYEIAQGYGYKPRLSSPATVVLDIFQTVPSTEISNDNFVPNEDYTLTIPAGMTVNSPNGTVFRTVDDCVFADSSSLSPRQNDIYEVDDNNKPSKYLLKKSVKAVSGTITTETFTMGAPERYKRIALGNSPVLEILSVTDSDGNKWYEVPFLAQDTVYGETENNAANSPDSSGASNFASFLVKLIKTSKRFTTFIRQDNRTELRFGAGVSSDSDEEVIPNPSSVGSNLPGTPSFLDTAFDPANFLNTKTYGQSPSNTTLTIKYSYGGGIDDNTASDTITSISGISYQIDTSLSLDGTILQNSKDSVAVTNPLPATGGGGSETTEQVKMNAGAHFQAQSRVVTMQDYITRVYSLPPKYGNIAKIHIGQDEQIGSIDQITGDPNYVSNPLALNMYTLGYDQSKNLIGLNNAVKENIKVYLSQYRMMTDAVNIKDAWIINIAVKFAILTRGGHNKNEVLLKCIDKIKQYFNIDKWQINQPINLADIAYEISLIDGVASIVPPEGQTADTPSLIVIENRWNSNFGYSGNMYDIPSATYNGIVYTAKDPSIFEMKFPNTDIIGNVIGTF